MLFLCFCFRNGKSLIETETAEKCQKTAESLFFVLEPYGIIKSYKVTIQSSISIPLTLYLDVASRHMKFQKNRSFMRRNSRFFFHFAWLGIVTSTG